MSDLVKIELRPLGQTIEVERGASLRSALHPYGVEFPCGGDGRCAGCRVKVVRGVLPVTADEAWILTPEQLAEGWRLACRSTAESDAVLEIEQWEAVILADHSSFELTPRSGLGIAVDLGTTTVVAQLLDLRSGTVLGVRTGLNPHTVYGSDVMSRVQIAGAPGQRIALAEELRRAVGGLVSKLLESAAPAPAVDRVVMAGNTVMHHLFCAIDVEPLSHSPFETTEGGLRVFSARELGWDLRGDPPVGFLPCLGGFVGSDILCGVLATRMHERDEVIVLVDLGTNGEIVAGNRRRMLCASTAAGPAFEGGRIGMGMRAATGAISEVAFEDGRFRCRVVGNASPRGICGSGLVDAVAAGLELGLVQPSGRLTQGRPLELVAPVTLSQNDVRQLQLAKAAIAAGIRILGRRFGGDAWEGAPVYLAGAFGNYVNRKSACRIGLVRAPVERIESAGNTALLGAKMALFAPDPGEDFGQIRSRIEHVALAADPEFQKTFVDEMAFPE